MNWKILFAIVLMALPKAHAQNEYVFPSLISSEKMMYPRDARQLGWEGWAYYSFTIGKDGRTKDIRIIDSNGVKRLNAQLVKHVASQVYSPASLNGEPVEERSGIRRAVFLLTDKSRGARSFFYKKYKHARTALTVRDFDKAQESLDTLQAVSKRSLYEELYLQSLYVAWFTGTGDAERAYAHVQRLIDFYRPDDARFKLVDYDYFIPFFAQAYQYERNSMMIGSALATAEKLMNIAPDNETVRAVTEDAENIMRQLDGKPFLIEASLAPVAPGSEYGRFTVQLLNNRIALSELSGDIENTFMRCTGGYALLTYVPGETWFAPPEWGQCVLHIEGRAGTSFNLTEYPGPR